MLDSESRQVASTENQCFSLSVLSVIGDRADQQDSFGYKIKQDEGLVIVCDGMGGHEGGKIASNLAVEKFLSVYEKDNFSLQEKTKLLIDTAKTVDCTISNLTNQEGNLMKAGSTLVSVVIEEKKLIWCSVGDSRAYLMRRGEMVQLTQDHNYRTVLLEQKRVGLLDEKVFWEESERGEALISFLGIGNLELIDYSCIPFDLETEDIIVIMTDGLYKLVTDNEIFRILDNFKNINEAVLALDMKAKKNAKNRNELRDNMTVAIIRIK